MAEEKDKKAAHAPARAEKPKAPGAQKPKADEEKSKAPAKKTKGAEEKAKAAPQDAKAPSKKGKAEVPKFPSYTDAEGDRSAHKVPVLSVEGEEKRTVHLPRIFDEPVRTDLIARAVQAARANRRQPYGAPAEGVYAGRRHSTEWSGKGQGISRVQRLKSSNRGATSPNNVGGARAHPPRVVQNRWEKINVKERRRARRSALAAVANADLVEARGHQWDKAFKLPIVVEADVETLFERAVAKSDSGDSHATRALLNILANVGVTADLNRARDGINIRAGRGKMRGRRYRRPRSVLIVASNAKALSKAARNIPGVDVVAPSRLSTESLAPGGSPGRLTVFTESALNEIRELR